jgi:DNA-binding MarR family transcriptional regulator
MELSTEQRVLLHISRFTGNDSQWEAPYELSQAGISASLGIPQSSISRALKSLKEKGWVYDRTMYIKGEKRKKSAYFLTETGLKEAEDILRSLREMPVNVSLNGEIRLMSIAEAENLSRQNGNPLHPIQIYEMFRKGGTVGLDSGKYMRFHVPDLTLDFIGRADLMEDIEKRMHGSMVILIKGMAGMGKSTLLSKMAERLSEKHHVFWHSFRSKGEYYDLLRELNEFLTSIGKKPVERKAGARGYFEALRKSNSVLILDDLQLADEKSSEFIRELSDMMFSSLCDFRILAASREDMGVFRKSALGTGKLYEMTLGPLKKEELREMFGESADEVYSLTGGVPLFVQLYKNTGFRLSDAEKIMDEEIFPSSLMRKKSLWKRQRFTGFLFIQRLSAARMLSFH